VTQYLSALNEAFAKEQYGQNPYELYEPIRYIMGLGGKRLRPMLTLLATNIFDDNWQKALRPAMAVEVFHNFSLVHDDIMDKAPLRRGKATVHAKWNEPTAILAGDVMLVKAYEMLADVPDARFKEALFRFNETACGVCEGQQMDMNFETRNDVPIEEYIEMIRLKTSVLLGFALELGGIIAGADATTCVRLREIGESMGIGFQIKDDILDVYGDPEKFGKQVGGDIISNKKTFMLIEAMTLAQGHTALQLNDWLAKTDFDNAEKVKAVTALYDELGVKTLAEKSMDSYFDKAFGEIDLLPVADARKQELVDFGKWLMARDS
jgi:geranylgeranyl diphosphate synthase, type II